MSKSLFKEKTRLYKRWSSLKDLSNNNKINYKTFKIMRDEEEEYYEKWRFINNFEKAKEKVENEKKNN